MSKTHATRTLSIRLPEDLADRLGKVADLHRMTRTAVLIEILDGAIDTWKPATHPQDDVQDDTLHGAVETIRLELDETIERVARLERVTRLQHNTQDTSKTAQHDSGTPSETYSAKDLAIALGLNPDDTNLGTKLKTRGYRNLKPKGGKGVWVKY